MPSDLILKPHQLEGAEYLAAKVGGRAVIADPPGMMKTLTTIHGMALAGVERPLIVCPAVVRSHWKRSVEEYLHSENGSRANFTAESTEVRSYDEIVRGGEALRDVMTESRDLIHLDEFHFLKNIGAQRTQLILGKKGYVRHMPFAWATSGTPVSKSPVSIWTMLSTFFPQLAIEYGVTTLRKFVDRFAVVEFRKHHGKTHRQYLSIVRDPEAFHELCNRMWLRRDNLPGIPVLWQTLRLDGATTHAHLDYTATSSVLEEAVRAIDAGTVGADALAAIATDPEVSRARRRLGEHKAPAVIRLLRDELENSNEKIAVFAYHKSVLNTLREGLGEFGVAFIDGGVNDHGRQIAISRFAEDPMCRVFVGQNEACGTGMDGLQYSNARRVILVEPSWNAVTNIQLAKRLARHGQQSETVAVQMIALAGTLDESVVRLNQRESQMLDAAGLANV